MRNRRNKKSALARPVLLLVMFSIAAVVGLSFLRFRSSRLEDRLIAVNRAIDDLSAQEAQLDSSLRGLVSPIRIYDRCKDQLGMYTARLEVVNLPQTFVADAGVTEPEPSWRSRMFAFFGLNVN